MCCVYAHAYKRATCVVEEILFSPLPPFLSSCSHPLSPLSLLSYSHLNLPTSVASLSSPAAPSSFKRKKKRKLICMQFHLFCTSFSLFMTDILLHRNTHTHLCKIYDLGILFCIISPLIKKNF